jgi:hypothetical protein
MKRIGYFALIILVLGSIGGSACANGLDLTRIGLGARSIALGRTQATGQDLYSVFVNPANAAFINRFSAASMYAAPAEDLYYSLLGLGFPIKDGNAGTFAISYLNAGVSGVPVTSLDAVGHAYPTSNFDYSSKLLALSYGNVINSDLFAGISLKLMSRSFDGINGGSASGAGLDAGVIFYPKENLVFGLAVQNIFPEQWGSLAWGTGTKEKLPLNLKMGTSFAPSDDLLLLGDYDSLGSAHAGVEYTLKKNLALRGGAEYLSDSINFSAGVGVKSSGFSFDYAYYLDTSVFENSAHYFSIGYELPLRTMEIRPFMPAQAPQSPVCLD